MRCSECYLDVVEGEAECAVCGGRIVAEYRDLLEPGPYSIVTERRAPQLQIAGVIEAAIKNKKHAIVEAGCGTGKGLAYAVPAFLEGSGVLPAGLRTVISTATLGLQGQLIQKDLPAIQKRLEEIGHLRTFAIAKGRSNYICGVAAHDAATDRADPVFLNKKILDFADSALLGHTSGDKAELKDTVIPKEWSRISAEECVGISCSHYATCGYIAAKRAIKGADIIVANHALVGADLARSSAVSQSPILGRYNVLIMDEAHKAADYIRNAFSVTAKTDAPNRAVKVLNKRGLTCWDGTKLTALQQTVKKLFASLPSPGRGDAFVTINPDALGASYTALTQEVKVRCAEFIDPAKKALSTLTNKINFGGNTPEARRDYFALRRAASIIDTLASAATSSAGTVTAPVTPGHISAAVINSVTYVKMDGADKALVITPLDVGRLIGALFPTVPTVIATSATLSVGGSFDAVKRELGLITEPAYEVSVKSPFNYKEHSVLYVSQRVPEAPKDKDIALLENYATAVADEIIALADITHGRLFALFTSKSELELVAGRVRRPELTVLKQDDSTTVPALLRRYRDIAQNGGAPVLLGLKSFWEGVSIEGDDLSCVVITKLPFPSVSDPIYKALCDNAGDAWFSQVAIPAMVKDLQQGTGRLIRTTTDVGIVAILDPRVRTASYGKLVLSSLPFSTKSTNIESVRKWYRRLRP